MERLGFKAVPLATKFIVEAPALQLAYTSGLSDEELRQAEAVSSAFGAGWRGHLVAQVDDAWLLDSTFDQADDALAGRPFRLSPECVLFPLDGARPGYDFLADYRGVSDGGVELRVRFATLNDASWQTTDAWNDEALPLIGEFILARLKR
jgi:hypothetical protein